MKWFKSKKQKRIEELEEEVKFLKDMNSKLSSLESQIGAVDNHISNLKVTSPYVSPYTVSHQPTETIVAKTEVYPGMPMSSDDIETRLIYSLAEGVAKHMVVYKYNDPKDMKDIYSAMIKVVTLPKDESWANQLR